MEKNFHSIPLKLVLVRYSYSKVEMFIKTDFLGTDFRLSFSVGGKNLIYDFRVEHLLWKLKQYESVFPFYMMGV